jgi:hypothetical protein
MSERMTSEELLKRCDDAERYAKFNDGEVFNCALDLARALRPLITKKHALLAHLRASQTPPHAVTRDFLSEEVKGLWELACNLRRVQSQNMGFCYPDAIAQAEATMARQFPETSAAIERLSASPTAQPNIYTPGHDPFAKVDDAINKAQGWPTAPKGEA